MNKPEERDTQKQALVRPGKTLLVLLSIGLLCLVFSFIFPVDGLKISDDFVLVFPSPEEFEPNLHPDTSSTETIENLEEFLDSYTIEIDSLAVQDSLKKAEALKRKVLLKLQFNPDETHPLSQFFSELRILEGNKNEHVRVLHFGDSQIEGDRITGYLRNQFQTEFGGYGPGLLPAVEVVPSAAIEQSGSENWSRYTAFGKRDTLVKHSRYGILANFGKFSSPVLDSLSLPAMDSAWIQFEPSRLTYSRSRKYTQMRLWMGNNRLPFSYEVMADDSSLVSETIAPGGLKKKIWQLGTTPELIRLNFKGADSPEVYAVSLESPSGIHIDNIGMRGSSGTIFKRLDRGLFKSQIDDLDVSFIILQFGGNTVPYIDNEEKAKDYGNWFSSQIKYLKSVCPEASFLIIGPSDMATKEKNEFIT